MAQWASGPSCWFLGRPGLSRAAGLGLPHPALPCGTGFRRRALSEAKCGMGTSERGEDVKLESQLDSSERHAKEIIFPLEDNEEMPKVVDWTWSHLSKNSLRL